MNQTERRLKGNEWNHIGYAIREKKRSQGEQAHGESSKNRKKSDAGRKGSKKRGKRERWFNLLNTEE